MWGIKYQNWKNVIRKKKTVNLEIQFDLQINSTSSGMSSLIVKLMNGDNLHFLVYTLTVLHQWGIFHHASWRTVLVHLMLHKCC